MEQQLRNKLTKFTDKELNSIIKKNNVNNCKEVFFAKKELRLRLLMEQQTHKATKTYKKEIYQKKENSLPNIITLLVLAITTYGIYYLSNYYIPDINYNKFSKTTKGHIVNIIKNSGIVHGLEGSWIKTNSYTIEYNYTVDSVTYKSSAEIMNLPVNDTYISSLYNRFKNKSSIEIRYQEDLKKNSIIDRKASH